MKNLFKEIQRIFLSVRTTIFLLVTIALVSIIGTLIPQQKEAAQYIEQYSEGFYHLFEFFGFLDLFGSWWFRLLMILLTVNLVVCAVSRLPRIWTAKGLTRKEWIGRLGPHITHFSVIIILVGALMGNLWGFKGYVNIPEGESVNAVALKGSEQMLGLDFTIRLDKFDMSFYPGTEIPKQDTSEVTILEKGREVLKKKIWINEPLKYKGISFYQSGHGFMPPRPGEVKVDLEIIPKGDGSSRYRLEIADGERKRIPGTDSEVQFATFVPDFILGEGNRIISRSNQPNNPAIQVNIYQNGKLSFNGWSFLKYPDVHGSKDDMYKVKFVNLSSFGKPYTGLQVVKDPGVWVVWTGFGFLVLGLYFTFHLRKRSSHQKPREKGGSDD